MGVSIRMMDLAQKRGGRLSARGIAHSVAVLLLGRESRPRTILRGLASGYRISVSPADHLSYLIGVYEPHLQKAIRKHVRSGDTVYDIGANIGFVTLSCAKQVGPSGRVFAFEPVPQTAQQLRENVSANRLANVQVLEVAASDRSGESIIRMAENPSTASLMWHRSDSTASETTIKTVVIDELVEAVALPAPTFVKVDVEGAEGLVLKGMRRTLATAQPVLFIECSEAGRGTTWGLLRELGYRCQNASTGKPVNDFDSYCHSDFLWLPNTRP